MLKEGEIVTLGNKDYRITKYPNYHVCMKCDLKDCQKNKDYDALKAKMFALSCVDIIPIDTCFKEVVEQSPQVDCKC